DLEHSFWVEGLTAEQWEDGSWGAFHSRNTCCKQKILTTEMGVERARNLGLDAYHPILQNSSEYIRNVMRGVLPFPDRHEKNDRWSTGKRLFLASTLSLIHPQDPMLNADRDLWFEIASKTFQSGQYSPKDEINAHASLTGATVKDSYLVLSGKYQLNILGSIPGTLPQEIERSLLTWLWSIPEGIGYLSVPLYKPPPLQKPGHIDCWLASLELLARLYPSWMDFAQMSIEWLWDQRNEQGYWDFGTRPATMVYLPLSDSWRKRGVRAIDWTTRILILLQTYSQSANTPV
ncbi:MAG: hypothetical protein KAT29_15200, partial [Anaerolineales bacterium]|nr:hypothetical protein [Anaerolineales bacterium]